MKVLVTGATGFVGRYVVNELLKNDHSVIACSFDPQKAKDFEWFEKVNYKSLDISNLEESKNYFTYFDSPEKIIHLAWQGLPNYNSLSHIESNLLQNYHFLKNLVYNGAKDITVSGTCLEYGLQEGKLSEAMHAIPANPYSIAKDALRKFLEQLQKIHPFNLKWIRLFYMYGKGQHPQSIISQLETALNNGETEFKMSNGMQQRDYLPVEKVAEYIVKIALQEKESGIINCCSGVPITINQLVEDYLQDKDKTLKLIKGFYPYPDYEPLHFWGDSSKLRSILEDQEPVNS